MTGEMATDASRYCMQHGKYAGKLVRDLPEGYIRWLADQQLMFGIKAEDQAAVRRYLDGDCETEVPKPPARWWEDEHDPTYLRSDSRELIERYEYTIRPAVIKAVPEARDWGATSVIRYWRERIAHDTHGTDAAGPG